LAGKQTKCPVCGTPIQIPSPAVDAADDPLGLGDLRQYEPHYQQPMMPGAPQYGAQPYGTQPYGAQGYNPLAGGATPAGNYGWQQPAAGYGWQQQAPARGKSNLGIILGVIGGVAAVLLLLSGIGVAIALRFASAPNQVAQANGNNSDNNPNVPPVYQPPPEPEPADDATDFDGGEGAVDDGDTFDTPTTDVPMPPETPGGTIPPIEAEPTEPEPVELPTLIAGMEKWRASNPNGLQGAISVPNTHTVMEHHSWQTKLLPYLGHDELYRKFKFEKSWSDPPNLQAAKTIVPQFLNPSDDRQKWKGYPYDGIALTHFVGMSGVEDKRNVVAATLPRSDNRAGVFGYDRIAAPEEITDGLSQTIMLIGSGELASPWAQGGGATIRGAREPYFDPLTGFGSKGLSQPGALAVFADGSVREISASVNPHVFRSMCTIHGADSVDASQLGRPLEGLPFTVPPRVQVTAPDDQSPADQSPAAQSPSAR
jgi:hypothetical protein